MGSGWQKRLARLRHGGDTGGLSQGRRDGRERPGLGGPWAAQLCGQAWAMALSASHDLWGPTLLAPLPLSPTPCHLSTSHLWLWCLPVCPTRPCPWRFLLCRASALLSSSQSPHPSHWSLPSVSPSETAVLHRGADVDWPWAETTASHLAGPRQALPQAQPWAETMSSHLVGPCQALQLQDPHLKAPLLIAYLPGAPPGHGDLHVHPRLSQEPSKTSRPWALS